MVADGTFSDAFGGANLYAFVLGKPLKLRDPFGLSGLDFSPPLTMQPYNWRWAPIDPEAGIQRSLLETDPHFEAFRNYVDWLAGQKPSPINYIDMGRVEPAKVTLRQKPTEAVTPCRGQARIWQSAS